MPRIAMRMQRRRMGLQGRSTGSGDRREPTIRSASWASSGRSPPHPDDRDHRPASVAEDRPDPLGGLLRICVSGQGIRPPTTPITRPGVSQEADGHGPVRSVALARRVRRRAPEMHPGPVGLRSRRRPQHGTRHHAATVPRTRRFALDTTPARSDRWPGSGLLGRSDGDRAARRGGRGEPMTTRRRALFAGLSTLAIAGAAVGAAVPALAQDGAAQGDRRLLLGRSRSRGTASSTPRWRRRPRPAASPTSTRTASATTAAWSWRCARSSEADQPDIIFGDSFGNEEAVRAVAADYPDIPFVFGSGGGPAEPNFSVFDNWIHEPAYLAGWLAGGLTKSNTIGVVAGYPVPEVNRITNAFIEGAQAKNPEVEVKVTFINSWFDPATAKEAALAQIGAGADVLYAERAGVIEAAEGEGRPGRRQHVRPAGDRPRERHHQRHLEHDPHRRVRRRPGHRAAPTPARTSRTSR